MESRNTAYRLMQSCFAYSFNGTAKSVRELLSFHTISFFDRDRAKQPAET
ncbi:hypothetical protein [Pedobacter miscanthi]|nr:hypothetical protein [Pedobacter miscanthi]